MKLKKISEILARLIDATLVNTDEINDFTPGSTIMSIYEAFSMELEQYYMLTRENIKWGIEHGVLDAFGFKRKEARRAYGDITIEFHTTTQSVTYIPRGTAFSSSVREYQQRFEVIEDYYIPKGVSEFTLPAYCIETGETGNVPAQVINTLLTGISNVKRVYNKEDILTGRDPEKYEDLRNRFQAFIETRGRATVKALEYGTRTVEDIAGVYVHELVGYVEIYAHDLNGNLSDDLRAQVMDAIEDYRPAGIKYDIFPVRRTTVDVSIEVQLTDPLRANATLQKVIEKQIANYLNSKTVSQDVITADIISLVMNIDRNLIYDCHVIEPVTNIIVEEAELVRSGAITVDFV